MIKAIIWLHVLRLWRLRYSFLNMVVSNAMWVLLLILGVLLFVPRSQLPYALKSAYWTIACWSVISSFSSIVGGWTNFFISLGMVEEHMLRGISPFLVISGRLVIASLVSITTIIFMGLLVQSLFSVPLFDIRPDIALISLMIVSAESLLYSLLISAISMRSSISEQFLEIMNFAVIGILIVPISVIPEGLRVLYLSIPYVAPAYMLKVASGSEISSLFIIAAVISIIETIALLLIALLAVKAAESHIRRNGTRAIGFY